MSSNTSLNICHFSTKLINILKIYHQLISNAKRFITLAKMKAKITSFQSEPTNDWL